MAVNAILLALVVVLLILLVIRQRQLKQLKPVDDLENVLKGLTSNLLISRTDGKIQKVAGQLSTVLITNLRAKHILFFRKQRRFLELNYVYGMKNVQRSRYRVPASTRFLRKLTDGAPIRKPEEISELITPELKELLLEKKFNLVFPIFWMDNLFGVYFIKTDLHIEHPLIQTFLLFLNQNLSVAYQMTKLESARQILQDKYQKEIRQTRRTDTLTAKEYDAGKDDYSGHLVEVFNYRTVDALMSNLFAKVRAGLRADKLAYLSLSKKDTENLLKYSVGLNSEAFTFGDGEFKEICNNLQKYKIYDVQQLLENGVNAELIERLNHAEISRITTFSLFGENTPGVLCWASRNAKARGEGRILNRLENIGRRAMRNALEFEKVQEMSYTDSLTGLYNHRYFIKRLNEEIQRANRYNRKIGLLLFDIDDFKVYNDTFGHQWGDDLLRKMGATLVANLRSIDIIARYGGDEFCIIMPEADRSTCIVFMERLRHAIANTDFHDMDNDFEGRITISIGAAIYPDDAEKAEKLIYCSDMALLYSKTSGRNCNTLFSPEILEKK